jgi:tRNA-splicing ligase RtcB
VGFDISCGVRTLLTGLRRADIEPLKLAGSLFRQIPAGVGSKGKLDLVPAEMDVMLQGGARWAVERGYGSTGDLLRIEDNGLAAGALADAVSEKARTRQRQEMGTLGSGNHYLEVQEVVEVAAHEARLVRKVAMLAPVVCIKG